MLLYNGICQVVLTVIVTLVMLAVANHSLYKIKKSLRRIFYHISLNVLIILRIRTIVIMMTLIITTGAILIYFKQILICGTYCCVLLCCVVLRFPICALSLYFLRFIIRYVFLYSPVPYTQILSFVILIFRSYINRGFTTTRIGRSKTTAVVGAVAADINPTDNSSNATKNDDDDDDDDYVYCYSHPLFIKGFPFACEGMKVKSYCSNNISTSTTK